MYKALSCLALVAALWICLGSDSADAQVDADQVRGVDLVAGVNLVGDDVKADGRLFLPQRATRVRAVIVATNWGLGWNFYGDPQVRKLVEATESALLLVQITKINVTQITNIPVLNSAGHSALVMLLQRLARESGHSELAEAPLLFWGHSRAGNVGPAFAASHPQRTVAFVLYQSAAGAVVRTDADVRSLSEIPVLIIEGIVDPQYASAAIESAALWKGGRALGAPWTFANQADAPHGSYEHLRKANDLQIPWITAVLRHRLSPIAGRLRAVGDNTGWLGDAGTGDVAPYGLFPRPKPEGIWLPDESSARGWRTLWAAK
jgi:hypothetical protein